MFVWLVINQLKFLNNVKFVVLLLKHSLLHSITEKIGFLIDLTWCAWLETYSFTLFIQALSTQILYT